MYCEKTGYSQKEFTAEKLDIPGRNVLRKTWTIPEGMYCGKIRHSRKKCIAENWTFSEGMHCGKTGH
jgi:hypothetical protein